MRLRIQSVAVPLGSTIGYGIGIPVNDPTVKVLFAGDQRALVTLGEAMIASDEPIEVEVPDWAILDVRELPKD